MFPTLRDEKKKGMYSIEKYNNFIMIIAHRCAIYCRDAETDGRKSNHDMPALPVWILVVNNSNHSTYYAYTATDAQDEKHQEENNWKQLTKKKTFVSLFH